MPRRHIQPESIQGQPDALTLVVVFERPADHPQHYVVRRQFVRPGGELELEPSGVLFGSELAAHDFVRSSYPDATLLHGRGGDPNPTIVGVYL